MESGLIYNRTFPVLLEQEQEEATFVVRHLAWYMIKGEASENTLGRVDRFFQGENKLPHRDISILNIFDLTLSKGKKKPPFTRGEMDEIFEELLEVWDGYVRERNLSDELLTKNNHVFSYVYWPNVFSKYQVGIDE